MQEIIPMGCSNTSKEKIEELFLDHNYIAEKKYDGSRYICQIEEWGDIVRFSSRTTNKNGEQVSKQNNIPHIVEELSDTLIEDNQDEIKSFILDGEIDVKGDIRNFKRVQGIMGSLPERALEIQNEYGGLIYKVFDILELNGENLRTKTLRERREILEKLFLKSDLKYVELVEQYKGKDKKELLKRELENKAEGIILKNLNSIYQDDKSPTQTFYKVKDKNSYDGIVKGYVLGTGKYEGMLGTLTVYQYVGNELVKTANVSGMSDKQRVEFKERLDRGESWIIEFEGYGLFIDTNSYRHPTYKRIRLDKNEKECLYGKA